MAIAALLQDCERERERHRQLNLSCGRDLAHLNYCSFLILYDILSLMLHDQMIENSLTCQQERKGYE